MKVVFLRSNPVQPDPRLEKEANSLLKAGHEILIVAWDRSSTYKIRKSYLDLKNGKVLIYRIGIRAKYGGGIRENLRPLFSFQLHLIHWLFKYKKKYDVIHACDFDTAFVSGYLAKILKKKIIYDIFDYYVDAFNVPKILKKFVEKRDHKLINSAEGIIICSEKRLEQIKGTDPKKIVVIHNTPSFNTLNVSTLNLNLKKVKIAYVGILSEGRLLKELAEVIINNPHIELHIGGFGSLHEYFHELSLKYINVFYYGKLEYSATLELEKSCDIITAIYDPEIPNHYFAAPNKFYEALMLGKPLIMVNGTGMSEIVKQEDIGELIDYERDSLQDGINRIIKRREEWPTMASKMQILYDENYSWDKMELRLLDLYKSIDDE